MQQRKTIGETTRIVFGRRGNSAQYLLGGWAHDDSRTWTIGHQSHALLPCPRRRGAYLLSIVGSAFVADAVPFQRLVVLANGAEVGRFLLSDAFRVDCVVPWRVLDGAEALALDFRHPDAARPSDIADNPDPRWVALALTSMTLKRAPAGTAATHCPPPGGADDDALPAPLRQRRAVGRGPQAVPYRQPGGDWMRRPIMQHFIEAMARHPERVAIDDGARSVSFAQVVQHAAEIAGRIVAATAPDACVAVCVSSSVWLPIAVLACLTAGRCCVMIDPEDVATAEDAAALRPALQIVAPGTPAVLADVPLLVLSGHAPPIPGLQVAAMQAAAFRLRAPDGWVAVSEAAMLLDLAHCIEACHLNESDRHVTLPAGSSHHALRNALAALLTGGTLHLRDPFAAGAATPLALLARAQATVCAGPLPALLALARLRQAHTTLRKLRLLRIEGGILHWDEVAALRTLLPRACHILYAYAPVETLTCIQHFVAMPTDGADDIVPAGAVLNGFSATVAAPDGSALPDGTVGELVVSGALLGRVARTGQMARRGANGLIAFASGAAFAAAPDAAVRAAWQAVLGAPPRAGEVFGAAGGDSLKLIEFAMELENRLGGRLPMSLLTLQMDAAEIAVALAAPRAAAAPVAHELVQRFESLGRFCEFGFVQRACQAEPYSLLRFAGAKAPGLIAAIERGLEGFGAAETLTLGLLPTNEYQVRDSLYGFAFHTDLLVDQVSAADMLVRESRRLGFLAARMRADLAAARSIFVFRSDGPEDDAAMPALHAALRRHGPNRLLWVMSADDAHPIGSTRQLSDSLMVGYVDPFAVLDGGRTVLVESWLQICADAYRAFAARA